MPIIAIGNYKVIIIIISISYIPRVKDVSNLKLPRAQSAQGL